MAAVLAAGPGAVLSHRSAAALWDIAALRRPRGHRPGALASGRESEVHTSPLPPDEVTDVQGIPVTDRPAHAPRSGDGPPTPSARASGQRSRDAAACRPPVIARFDRPLPAPQVSRRSRRSSARPAPPSPAASSESRFLTSSRTAGCPARLSTPRCSAFECDFVWHEQRFVVELDGHAAHDTSAPPSSATVSATAPCMPHGWRVVRVTWRQLHQQPEALAADLREDPG